MPHGYIAVAHEKTMRHRWAITRGAPKWLCATAKCRLGWLGAPHLTRGAPHFLCATGKLLPVAHRDDVRHSYLWFQMQNVSHGAAYLWCVTRMIWFSFFSQVQIQSNLITTTATHVRAPSSVRDSLAPLSLSSALLRRPLPATLSPLYAPSSLVSFLCRAAATRRRARHAELAL